MNVTTVVVVIAVAIPLASCSKSSPTAPSGQPAIQINEIYSRGVSGAPDWIELYNGGTRTMDIGGYKIYDVNGHDGNKPKMIIPAGTSLPRKGHYVIVTDIPSSQDPSGFGLSSAGEEVWLEDATGAVIDDDPFPAMETTQTYSRIPDVSSTWQLTSIMTPDGANK